jgi:hypothetical protein
MTTASAGAYRVEIMGGTLDQVDALREPGDAIRASVSRSAGVFTLTLTDITLGQSQTLRAGCPARSHCFRNPAEVISEAPFGTVVSPLADFGKINYDSAYLVGPANVVGTFTSASWNHAEIIQVGFVSNA